MMRLYPARTPAESAHFWLRGRVVSSYLDSIRAREDARYGDAPSP